MIYVEFLCDRPRCPNAECVDVHHGQWRSSSAVAGYLPEGWTYLGGDGDGLPVVHCPRCSEAT